jgi:hypothetical protein
MSQENVEVEDLDWRPPSFEPQKPPGMSQTEWVLHGLLGD